MDPTDQDAPHVWMSYAEAASALGISARAVEGRAYRAKWEKRRGNDGTVRLAVPRGEVDPTKRRDVVGVDPTHGTTHGPTINDLLDDVRAAYEEAAAMVRHRAEVAEARVATLDADLAAERARATQAEAERETARIAAARAEGEAAALREQAKADCGRAELAQDAAAARVREAEAARDGARAELADWTSGGPLGRAWRALIYRRGRG